MDTLLLLSFEHDFIYSDYFILNAHSVHNQPVHATNF